MAWFTPDFLPGLNTLDKGLGNEGGWSLGNLVRFWMNGVQPIGGWQLNSVVPYDGIARGGATWRTAEGKSVVSWGTAEKLYARVQGQQFDITPRMFYETQENIFSTEDESDIVSVYAPLHQLSAGNSITFTNMQGTVGGLTIDGTYTVVTKLDENNFTIQHGSDATSTETDAGGFVDIAAPLPTGRVSSPILGYGTGEYGDGPYGEAGEDDVEPRSWSVANWGEFGVYVPNRGGLYEYQPETNYVELTFNGDFTTDADGWGLGTGWAWNTDGIKKTAGTASNASQDFDGVLEGGKTYEFIVVVEGQTAGELRFRVNAGTDPEAVIDVGTASSPISKNGTYQRIFLCPADPKDIVLEADDAFNGKVTSVSVKLYSKAYRIVTAPPRNESMFVDPRGIIVMLGTTLVDGSYSAVHYRCCDLGNNRSWVPDTGSIASEQAIQGAGGKLLQGINTAEQNIIGGDEGIVSLQYIGEVGDAFNEQILGNGCGLMSSHSMAASGGFVFWISNTKQFYMFRGVSIGSLGKPEIVACPIEAEVFDNLDRRQMAKVHTGINTRYAEAWFFYPDVRDTADGDTGECSRVAAVNWTQPNQQGGFPWAMHELARSTWLEPGIFENPIGFSCNATGDNYLYDHEVGNSAAGDAMGWSIETSSFDMAEGETLAVIDEMITQFSDQVGNVAITIKSRDNPRDDWAETIPTNADGGSTCRPTDSYLYTEIKSREFAIRFSEGTAGSFFRLRAGNLRMNFAPSSARH